MDRKKSYFIARLIVIFLVLALYSYLVSYPEFKNKIGSSDTFINTNEFKDMLEININDKINFSLVINEENNVYHLFFFENMSLMLYNKNIENTSLPTALKQIINILYTNDSLPNKSSIKLISYTDITSKDTLKLVQKTITQELSSLSLQPTITTTTMTLEDKFHQLGINYETKMTENLTNLDLYSKELYNNKNTTTSEDNTNITITESTIRNYMYNVYLKIEQYTVKNNIINQEINQSNLLISNIPADAEGKIYPTSESWYYVKNGAIYAQIKLNINKKEYTYCYQGGVDKYKKGEC